MPPVRLEPPDTLRVQAKGSTTEPLRSHYCLVMTTIPYASMHSSHGSLAGDVSF